MQDKGYGYRLSKMGDEVSIQDSSARRHGVGASDGNCQSIDLGLGNEFRRLLWVSAHARRVGAGGLRFLATDITELSLDDHAPRVGPIGGLLRRVQIVDVGQVTGVEHDGTETGVLALVQQP